MAAATLSFGPEREAEPAKEARVVGSELVDTYTVYVIQVTDGNHEWTIKHRYSDFHDLHEKLVAERKIDKSLLPPKKIIGKNSRSLVEKRERDLEVYLQTLLTTFPDVAPRVLAHFLHFHLYEVNGVTAALAEELFEKGEQLLGAGEVFAIRPLQLYAITEQLQQGKPTCASGDAKTDLGHILDFTCRLKYLKVSGTEGPFGTSNIKEQLLPFDLSIFKSLHQVEISHCDAKHIRGLVTSKPTLATMSVRFSATSMKEVLAPEASEFDEWEPEGTATLGGPVTAIIPTWQALTTLDLSHNSICEIDESVKLIPKIEYLDLSHNGLRVVDNLQHLYNLVHLDLSYNKLSSLEGVHTKLGNVKTLNLAGNFLESLSGLHKLYSLVNVDLRDNRIEQLDEVKSIGSLPCLERLTLLNNPLSIIPDYRTKVLSQFGERASEICLDDVATTEKELDTVEVLKAIQKAKDVKSKLSNTEKKAGEDFRLPPAPCIRPGGSPPAAPASASLPQPILSNQGIMFVQEEALASSLSSTDSLPPEDHRPIARACSDSLESIPAGQVASDDLRDVPGAVGGVSPDHAEPEVQVVPGSGQIIFLPFTCIGYTATNQDFIQRLSTLIRQAIERQLPAWIEAANQREEAHGEQGEEEEEEEEEETPEQPTAGDVFVLEMVLNRETKKMMKEKRPRSKLPRALRGLMGEANIRFARGEREEAVLMCMEIIRQAPLAYEPFSTLAMIYEDQGDMEKSLQFELIAAHLNPSDTEEWVRLAEMSLEQDNIKQASFCYTKALKYEPTNVRYLWERSSLYEQMGDHKMAMDGYRRILNLLSPSDGERFMQLARDMAKSYYEANDVISAINVIEEAFSKHQGLVSMEDVNIAAELYISNKQYDKALEVITDFSGIMLEKKIAEDGTLEENTAGENIIYTIPDGVPIDITVKLMVCLVHLNILEPLNPLLTTLVEQNPEDMGDLYLDVAEAFLDVGEYSSALPLLSALVCSERYNLAVVWLRHAECLKALGYMERAAESYGKVVDLAPLHLDARISLSTLQQQLGRPEKALEALEPMYDPDTLAQDANAAQQELKLLLHRSTLLFSQGKIYGYVDTLLTMLAMLLKVAMNRAQVCLISSSKSGERHLYLIKVSRDKISDSNDQETANCDAKAIFAVLTSVLTKDDWWNLLLKAIYSLCDLSRFQEAELLVDSSLEYYSFYDDRQKRKELEYFGLSAAILDKNFRKAYNYIRIMVMENVNKPQLWNIFNQVTMHSQDVRHHRFCLRLMLKNPDNHALCVLNGHNAFVSGSFKHALGQYTQAFRTCPNEPLYSLCIGLTFIHMASQKCVLRRHALIVQGFSFLNRYLSIRGPCQESFYNLGRGLHQLGLTHLAIHYYQKALELPPLVVEGIEVDQLDLRRDIAYNLSLIYQSSGNTGMAQKLLYTYCSI